MPETRPALAVLGTRWAVHPQVQTRWRGFLGMRMEVVELPPLRFVDWTVDGEAVRDRFGTSEDVPPEITLMVKGATDARLVDVALGALVADGAGGTDPDVHFDDGRVALLFCPFGDGLECGALSTELRWTETTVEWHDLAYQSTLSDELMRPIPSVPSARFERRAYEETIRSLLDRWGTRRAI